MEEQFPAHIRTQDENTVTQTVQEHCRAAARIAGDTLHGIGLGTSAYLAGLLHDAGKYTKEFRDYLETVTNGESVRRGSVNHTFAGTRYILEHFRMFENTGEMTPIAAELLAYAVGAHHGLFDCVGADRRHGFRYRLERTGTDYDAAMERFLEQCAGQEELETLFRQSVAELTPILEGLCDLPKNDEQYDGEVAFYLGMLARLLLSAVIEGDRRDTAGFMNGAAIPCHEEMRVPMWKECLSRVEEKLNEFPQNSEIAHARSEISRRCREFAERPGGVYRLNVPTGAGKTLSSLRYALAHAACWNKTRIILVSPLLSILDQNAKVVRDYLQDDAMILEHHSNVMRESNMADAIMDGTDPELLAENWCAPIIITTLVQLLNVLFAGKTSCIRRFQALTGSVLVIDEVQTVPARMLTLFNLAVNFLSEVCHATVVLCSATQPCLESTPHPIVCPIEQIVPYEPALWEVFSRTDLIDAGSKTLKEIPQFALETLERTDSLLIVCNKKTESEYLYHHLSGGQVRCFHLSAAMCLTHRRQVLEEIYRSLRSPGKTICIATQVIEAGVDISFGSVIRLSAGLDHLIQAAGRCNRNGESDRPLPVYVLSCKDENLTKLQDIQRAKTAMTSLLSRFRNEPQVFQNDLSSDSAVQYYYNRLYADMPYEFQDYAVKGLPSIYSMLSSNERWAEPGEFALNQAFKEAGTRFQVFDDETQDVLVPYGDGAEMIAELCGERAQWDAQYLQNCLDRVKPYTVSLFQYQIAWLEKKGGIMPVCGGNMLALMPEFYGETGVLTEQIEKTYLEVNV